MRENTNNELAKEIGPSDIARLANVTPAVVSNWKRRKADFPNPVSGANTKRPRFLESEITAWLKENDLLPRVDVQDFPPSQTLVEEIRNYLEFELIKSPNVERYSPDLLLTLGWWYSRELEDPKVQKARRLLDEKYSGENSFDDTKSLTHYWETHPHAEILTGLPKTGIELAEIISSEFHRVIDWRRYGEFWSNEAISKCFAELLRPTPANQTKRVLIFDPCVGSGSDLLAVSERWPEASLFGAEINRLHSDLTTFLFALRGHRIEIANTDSLRENTLEKQTADIVVAFPPFGVRLDKDLRDHPQWTYGDPGSNADNAWVQIVLNSLSQNGRAAILLPHNFCFQTGANLNFRKTLVRNNLLDAVISIPPGTLQSTTMPTVMFVLAKDRTTRKHARKSGEILFIDTLNSSAPSSSQAEEVKEAPYMTPNFGAEIYLNWLEQDLRFDNQALQNLEKIFTTDEIRNVQDDRGEFFYDYLIRNAEMNSLENYSNADFANFYMATVTDYDQLSDDDFNLSPTRYLSRPPVKPRKSLEMLTTEINDWTNFIISESKAVTKKLTSLQSSLNQTTTEIKVIDMTFEILEERGVIEIITGVSGLKKNDIDEIEFYEDDWFPIYRRVDITNNAGKGILSKTPQRYAKDSLKNRKSLLNGGDVIFANIQPSKGFPVMTETGEFLLGSDLFAVRVIDPSLITQKDLLRWGHSQSYEDQRDRYATGNTIPRISNKDWRKFVVTFPANQRSRQYFEEIEEVNNEVSFLTNGLSKSLQTISELKNDLFQSFPVEESK